MKSTCSSYQRISIVFGLIATIAAVIHFGQQLYAHYFPPKKPQQICIDNLLSRSYLINDASISENPYVRQNALEEVLSRMIGNKGYEYLVVVGPKDVGKSTLINHVIPKKRGIIGLTLTFNDHDVLQGIIKEICGDKKDDIEPKLLLTFSEK